MPFDEVSGLLELSGVFGVPGVEGSSFPPFALTQSASAASPAATVSVWGAEVMSLPSVVVAV